MSAQDVVENIRAIIIKHVGKGTSHLLRADVQAFQPLPRQPMRLSAFASAFMPPRSLHGTFCLVRQEIVSRCDLFELLFDFRIAWIQIGMQFLGERAVGFFV